MIKNIIFDVGGVLLTWNPESYITKILGTEVDEKFFAERIFRSLEWKELDRGSYSVDKLHRLYLEKYPEISNEINLLMERWFEIINPINENIALIPKLKENGYKLYIISNYVKEAIEEMKRRHNFFDYFEGLIVSCYVNFIKPELDIYNFLLKKYKLNAEQCLFIDDSKENTNAAEIIGIKTITYTSNHQLLDELDKCQIRI